MHRAVELVATEQQSLSERTDQNLSAQDKRIDELEASLQEQKTAFAELEQQLRQEDSRKDYRQRAPGGDAPAGTLTNC